MGTGAKGSQKHLSKKAGSNAGLFYWARRFLRKGRLSPVETTLLFSNRPIGDDVCMKAAGKALTLLIVGAVIVGGILSFLPSTWLDATDGWIRWILIGCAFLFSAVTLVSAVTDSGIIQRLRGKEPD